MNYLKQFSSLVKSNRAYRSAKSAFDKAEKRKSVAYKKAVAAAKKKMKSKTNKKRKSK